MLCGVMPRKVVHPPKGRQYRPPAIRYQSPQSHFDIEYPVSAAQGRCMKHMIRILLLSTLMVAAHPGHADDCYADYKAKQDNPLRLHYGVARVSACSKQKARTELSARLAAKGWTLLNIVSVFDQSGLAERKDSAGANYLRY
jgi:hypothetical protein